MIQELTRSIVSGMEPDSASMEAVAGELMAGTATPVLAAAFLAALETRGVTASDLAAFARVMRRHCSPFGAPEGNVLDTCGTGGDHSGTFNISTAAAFVAAGAGVRVAKHGNRSVTSTCGSADVLAALGVTIDAPTPVMEKALEEAGICFLFAPLYHPAMKHVAPIRKELGFRTIFNRVGPLANPAGANRQVIGAFSAELAGLMASALQRLGSDRALVVHGAGTLDEISLNGPTEALELTGGAIRELEIIAQDYGFAPAPPGTLSGGTAEANAGTITRILDNEPGPPLDITLLNAGAAIWIGGGAESLRDGIACARESVQSGAAREKLEQLRRITTA